MSKRGRDDRKNVEDQDHEEEDSNYSTELVLHKKAKTDEDEGALTLKERKSGAVALAPGVSRSSALAAPNIKLTGHQGHIYTCRFSRNGTMIASAGYDRMIFLWNVYGDCKNSLILKGHKNSILDLWWGQDNDMIYSASADNFGAVYDIEAGARVKKLRDHTGVVNSICGTRRGIPLVATGSDDGTVLIHDLRQRKPVKRLQQYEDDDDDKQRKYQITSVAFSDDGSQVFSGGVDADIHCWELRKDRITYDLTGHNDIVTGLRVSPDGSFLLSNSEDNTLRSWDIRPYVKGTRALGIYTGHQHDFQQNLLRCAFSHDGSKITAGSADTYVYIWDFKTTRILYKLPGHKGSVNDVDFHPQEPIILSGSSDHTLFMGEVV